MHRRPVRRALTGCAMAAVAALVPKTVGRKSGRFDLLGTAAVTLALTCLVWGLTTARGDGWTNGPVLAAISSLPWA